MVNPNEKYPMEGIDNLIFLKNFITRNNVEVWDFSYYSDFKWAEDFENSNILYHFDFNWDKLKIGKFCQIWMDTKFIMNWWNHMISWISSYPFGIFWDDWSFDKTWVVPDFPNKWDTIVWNDVWFWHSVTIMPWVKIGNWVIIGANSHVVWDIPDYSIVWWNPAKIIRKRFDDETISKLLNLKWWDKSYDFITKNIKTLCQWKIDALEN